MYLELDCPIRTYIGPRRAPQYGDALHGEINARLDAARGRLEDLVEEIQNARRH